ncbi:MAG: four helix bundle protein [Opitutus sp.]
MAQFDHERLRVYQEGLRFVAFADAVVADLPQRIAARDQLVRASTSIALNIGEGNGKRSKADRCRHLDVARGSALESAAGLDVLVIQKPLNRQRAEEGAEILVAVVSMVMGLPETFGAQVHEDVGDYGSNSHDGNFPSTITSTIIL